MPINLQHGIGSKQILIKPWEGGAVGNPKKEHLFPGAVLPFFTVPGKTFLRIRKVEPGRPIYTLNGWIEGSRTAFQALYNPENGTGVLYIEE